MPICKWIRTAAVCLASAGLLFPTTYSFGQTPSDSSQAGTGHPNRLLDVQLEAGNVLRGFTVNEAGEASAHTNVFLFRDQNVIATGVSDNSGEFAIGNVRGGIYQLAAGDRVVSLRCWTDDAAPPHATQSAMLRVSNVERGQIHPASCMLANPWVIAGVVAAAITIPIAIKANSDDRDSGS